MDTINATIAEGVLLGRVYKTPSEKKYYGFTGIPYAEQPTGKLRFKEPKPVEKWNDVKDVTKDSKCFIQYDYVQRICKDSENLLLHVYTSKLESQGSDPMPVMVYFHGGGFAFGSAEKATFGPDFLIEKDVVIVTVHYRVGLLGFLCLDIPEAPGNAGLKDQLLALKWVQKNIAVFNGDPSNVTIFGTSAGAASVEYHLISPQGKGLFHKAIGLSGSAINPWALNVDSIKYAFEVVKNLLGRDVTDKVEMLDLFISASAEDLVKASFAVQEQYMKNHRGVLGFCFVPVKEKRFPGVSPFLNEDPVEVLKSGQQKVVPFITGFCEKEGLILPVFSPDNFITALTQEGVSAILPFKVDKNAEIISKLNEEYFKNCVSGDERNNGFISYFGDVNLSGGIAYSAKLHAANNPNVYLYEFSYDGGFNGVKKMFNVAAPKATHGDQEGYISFTAIVSHPGTDEDRRCRERMVNMFTTFAKTGNPTPNKTLLLPTTWEPVQRNKTKCFNIGEELKMEETSIQKLTELWEEVYEYHIYQ